MGVVKKKFFPRGVQREIAELVGMRQGYLSDVLRRIRTVSKERAKALDAASKRVGYHVPFEDWLFNFDTNHPAFVAKRKTSR